jgi:LysM repeat protein
MAVSLTALAGACSTSQHVRLRPGETLPSLPPTVTVLRRSSTTVVPTYVVLAGDTFAAIARRLGVDPDTLAELNQIVDRNRLAAGQLLVIPTGVVPTTTTG